MFVLSTNTPWLSPLPPFPHVTGPMEAPAPACPRTSRETLRRRKREDCRHGFGGWGKSGMLFFGNRRQMAQLDGRRAWVFYAHPLAWTTAPRLETGQELFLSFVHVRRRCRSFETGDRKQERDDVFSSLQLRSRPMRVGVDCLDSRGDTRVHQDGDNHGRAKLAAYAIRTEGRQSHPRYHPAI